jgi:hypothetical protein
MQILEIVIYIKIDGVDICIGSGSKEDIDLGEVYSPIRVGEKVTAKLLKRQHSGLSILYCESCYIRKD